MESIIARALEYTLSHWLKSFSRDQFKLQGRTAQLSNLDINGDALHASVGLPPAINVITARVGKLEITLPSVSNVQVEPIVVRIDRLDLVLEENADFDSPKGSGSVQPTTASAKGSGYGFADKIADGMTLEVGTVNLLLETRGGSHKQGKATWAPPLASITIRNLLLYTTNENWQVVNLKEARDFSNNKRCIYVFKKLEWESLSIDLLPHPDMFADTQMSSSGSKQNSRDDDGVKRLFFGGERFLEGISGEAYITVQRTEQNSPLGLEVQLHITEAVCPALSEPGLRALLRFMTGLYVCLNRGDVDPMARKNSEAVAGRSLVSIIVDHIFFCIKDSEFQLELLMQSLFFSRASISDGKYTKNLSRIMVGGLFLRDTFSRPPCTLIQPSMQGTAEETLGVPDFCKNFCPAIYPLGDQQWQVNGCSPQITLHSLQTTPSPAPPCFASQTVIECQPLLINLHEESCLRISSFLADGIVVNPGCVLPDFSVSSFEFTLRGFDLIVPLDSGKTTGFSASKSYPFETCFSGARLHVDDLIFSQTPSLNCKLLNLDKDPVCFALWPGQPTDASMKKWATRATLISLSLETSNQLAHFKNRPDSSVDLWTCVELREACFEAAMVTVDGSPLVTLPPPEGIVRIGFSCQQYLSNASVEQLFFVLDLYSYFGRVSDKIAKIGRSNRSADESFGEQLLRKLPSDTSVSLAVNELKLKFLETSSPYNQGMPLVQFGGQDLFVKVMHRALGGAFAVSTSLTWNSVQVDCVVTEGLQAHEIDSDTAVKHEQLVNGNGPSKMRTVFWIDNQIRHSLKPCPFLDISIVHVMPFNVEDTECHSLNVICKISGVRLGGGMNYTEALLHRFGILGPDGGPGEGLSKGIKYLSSGPLADLFKSSSHVRITGEEGENMETEAFVGLMELGKPDDIDVCIELQDWLFALEGAEDASENWWYYNGDGVRREERCWHTTFKSLEVKAQSSPKNSIIKELSRVHNYPVDLVMVSIEGLKALKPHAKNATLETNGGINLGASMVVSQDDNNVEMVKWAVENLRFSVKEPIEAIATKEEVEHLVLLCRSEIDSMGRIAAGILRLFKLEESFGKGTIDGLSNLGSESLDKIFSPEKLSRRSSIASISFTPSNATCESPHYNLESTVASLESVLSDSQAKCSSLVIELSSPEISGQHLADIKQLNQKLESLQVLLMRLRAQI